VLRDAPRILVGLFTEVDLSVLGELEALRGAGDELPASEALKKLLKRGHVLIEDLQARLVARFGLGDQS
jgi:hypothetical protein